MHTVSETHAFRRQAEASGMNEDEIDELIFYLAANPNAGAPIPGTGGCRKLRVAAGGRGKRGGYRTITFYSGTEMPVFLIAVFAKGERADLTAKERSALGVITKAIVAEYKCRVVKARA
jgi:hypothetical protein